MVLHPSQGGCYGDCDSKVVRAGPYQGQQDRQAYGGRGYAQGHSSGPVADIPETPLAAVIVL